MSAPMNWRGPPSRRSGRPPATEVEVPRTSVVRDKYDSQLFEQRLGAGDFSLPGRIFDVERLHDTVFDQHAVTLRADAEAACDKISRQAQGLGEFTAAVGKEFDLPFGARSEETRLN